MAANILPYLSVLSNIRCNLIPYHGTQNYYFQPYNDGKLKGYTIQYCPTGKVFYQRYCRCLPALKGHRKTAYSKKQYPNKYDLKSKLPFKPLSVSSTKKYRKVKKHYKLKNRNLFLRNPMMSHDSLRHEMKRRFNLLPHKLSAPSHKNHLMGQFQKSSSVHPIRNTIDMGPKHLIKKQSPKLKQKFRFFKKKSKHARNHKQERKPTVHPFLPVTSIDFSVNLDRQRLDFAQNTIENRLTSIGRRGSLPNFNNILHNTVPFEPGFDTNFNRQQMDSISRNTLLNKLFEPTQNLDINDPITEIFIPIEDTHHHITETPTGAPTGNSQHTRRHRARIPTGHSQHTRHNIAGIPTSISTGHSQNTHRHRARIPTGRSQHTRHNIAGMPTVISTGHSQHTHLNIAEIPRVTPTRHSQHTHNQIAGISTGHSQHAQNRITGITTGHSQHTQNHITGITTGHSQHTQNHIAGITTGHSQHTQNHIAGITTGHSQHTQNHITGITTGHSQHTQNHIAGHSQHTHNNIAGIHTAVPAGHSQTDRITSSHSGVSSASGDVIFNNGIVFSDASHINVDTVQDISVGGHISNVPEVNNDAIGSHNANDHIDPLTDIFVIPDIHTTTIVDHTEIIDKKTNSKKTNSKTDTLFPTLHNDALFVSDIFHSGVTKNVGGSGKPSNHVGDFPNGKEIAFQIAQFQDMNTKNNDFQHILKTTSSNHHTGLNGVIHNAGTILDISDVHGKSHIKAIPKSHILFSGFNINENKLFNGPQGLEPPHHLGEPSLNPFEVTNVGIINNGDILKQGITRNIDMGNIDLQSILSNEVIPVSIGRAKSPSGFNTGGTLINGGHIITELAEFVDGGGNGNGGDNTMVDGIKEKTIILSDAKKIPDALVFHNALPEFTPLKPTIPISLQKLHLDINNTKTATATASQTMIFTERLPSDICLGCKMDGGVGYTNHPTSCDRFVVCYPTDGGNIKPVTQLCPYGLFWSQTALTCRLTKDVYCPHEVCKFQVDKYQYASKRTCRSYWECQGGISVPQCCPWGYSYLDGRGCIEDSTCEIPDVACGIESNNKIIEWGGVCDKRPVVGKNSMYERKDHNKWIEEKCPVGWIYKIELCECTKISELVPPEYIFGGHTCVPEIYLPFTNDFSDHSGNNVYIRVENASLTSGAACFDGHSALAIPAFANMDYGKTLYIHVRYKQINPVTNLQTLVFNGDCDKMHTMMLGTKPSGNSLTLLTNLNEEKNIWVQSNRPLTDWRDVWLKLENGKIILQSTDHKISATLNGTIARSECGMKIGWGKGFDNFVGCIDEVSIHRCHPETTV